MLNAAASAREQSGTYSSHYERIIGTEAPAREHALVRIWNQDGTAKQFHTPEQLLYRDAEEIWGVMADERECPLCDGNADYRKRDASRDALNVECERCGRFRITPQALIGLKPNQKFGLSSFCRRAQSGTKLVEILSTNVEQLLKSLPQYTPSEKLDNLLQLMGKMTPALGEYTAFKPNRDYPLLVLAVPGEVDYLIQVLSDRGYLDGTHDGMSLTMSAWEHLDEIRRRGPSSTRCFVAMWFHESMNAIYEQAIAPAINDAGYEPLRIDRLEHVNRIDDEIIGQIKRSRLMVADFTGQRHGVYFETGLMLGIGRPVIWMCHKDELTTGEGLHFDIRQFNFIDYESPSDAKKRLYDRILAIEGEGPLTIQESH